jgi:hypothetical protein
MYTNAALLKSRTAQTVGWWLMFAIIVVSTFACSVHYGTNKLLNNEFKYKGRTARSMSVNEALQAGFRIYDPEGYEVERFDGDDYWTTTPKP